MLTPAQLDQMVGRIALYPDELLAVTLPASTFPMQVVQGARFLESRHQNPSLQPREQWDTSVLALLNYPDVIEMMNQDLDWTWQLGEAVINQQQDVMAAIQQFRARAYAAGNLESNEQQIVVHEQQVIQITSGNPQVIYVPQYDPVIVVQPVRYPPVTYPPPYPAYYAPGAAFFTGMFVGAAIGYGLNWRRGNVYIDHRVNVSNVGNRRGGFRGGDRSTWRAPNRGGVGNRPGYRPGGPTGGRPGTTPGRRPSTAPGVAPGQLPGTRPGTRPGTGYRQPVTTPRGTRPGARPSARYNNRGTFGGYQRGNDARRHSQRGAQSRNRSRSFSSRSYGGGQRAQNRSAFSGQRSGNRSRSYSNRGSQSRRAFGGGRRGGGRRR